MTKKPVIKKPKYSFLYTNWLRKCGWCGGTHPVASDGRMLFCSHCGH